MEEKIVSSIFRIVSKYRQYEHFYGRWKRIYNIFFLTFTLLSANCHSANCCRLDTSLQSTTQQGAERRSASKVKRLTFELMGFAFWLKKRWQRGREQKKRRKSCGKVAIIKKNVLSLQASIGKSS